MNGIGHTLYYNNMLDALQGKDQALCDGQQGLLSLELLSAYRSASDQRVITLPMPSSYPD